MATIGSFNATTGQWLIGNVFPGQIDTLILPVSVDSVSGLQQNLAYVNHSIYTPQWDFSQDTAVVVIPLDVPPAVQIDSIPQVCEGDPPLLLTGSPGNGIWDGQQVSGNQLITDSAGTFEVKYIVTGVNGCVAVDTVLITVDTVPTVTLGADTALCGGDSLLLVAGQAPSTFNWNTGAQSSSIVASDSGWYSVTTTSPQGCAASDSIRVDVVPLSVDLGADTSFCAGDSLQLIAGNQGLNFLWSTGDTTNSIWVNTTGSYSVQVSSAGNCIVGDSINVQENPIPSIALGAFPAQICATGAPIVLSGNPPGGTLTQNGTTGDTLDPTVLPPGPVVIAYGYTDSNGCSAFVEDSLFILAAPTVSLTGLGATYCISDPGVQLSATPSGGTFSGPGMVSDTFVPALAGPGTSYSIAYSFTDPAGCTATDSLNTAVSDLPSPALAGPDQEIYGPAPVQLGAVTPAIGNGTWSAPGSGISFSPPNSPNATASGFAPGRYALIWTMDNPPCPANVDSLRIVVLEFLIPTGFSPNGDGVNDSWVIRGLERFPDAELTIFNRWGNAVFSAAPYNSAWDGNNSDGSPLSDDTYYYALNLGPGQLPYTGYVIIRR